MKNICTAIFILFAFITIQANEIDLIDDTIKVDKPHVLIVTNRIFHNENIDADYFPNKIADDGSLTFLQGYLTENKLMLREEYCFPDMVFHKNSYNDWLIFVHGDSKTLPDAAKRALEIQEQYQINVIVFSWPSKMDKGTGLKNFKNSRKNVEEGVDEFLTFLNHVKNWKHSEIDYFQNNRLSIMFHSLGNYYLEQLVNSDYVHQFDNKIFDNLIINAAAVNQKDHDLWLHKINMQERIYVNSNGRDFILRGVRVLTNWKRQLGESLVRDFASNATYVNFTSAIKSKFPFNEMHGYYLGSIPSQSDNIKNYYSTILHGEKAFTNNSDISYSKENAAVYNIKL